MPRKSVFTSRGKGILGGKKVSVSRRGISAIYQAPPEQVRLPTGQLLNIPESKIYRALEDLSEEFDAQVPLAGGRTLGGALCDFILPRRSLIIEFQGPFHSYAEGQERDFWRRVTREQAGFMVAYLFDHDLIHLHRRLAEILASPVIAAVMTSRH